MNLKTIKRFLVSAGILAGFLAAAAGPASAGVRLNHCDRTL
jgi:hypothetical protein